jgi:hypothetical protein
MTTIRRMISRLRYANDELVRAHEAMALPGTGATSPSAPAGRAGVAPESAAGTAEGDKPAA